jgi:lysozyme
MDISKAVDLCINHEGYASKPYLCPAVVPTIGYGSTFYPSGKKVTLLDPPITKTQAKKLLIYTLSTVYAPAVKRLCPTLEGDSFCAILDFTYNLGERALQLSTLRKKINSGDIEGAKKELMRWVYGGGKPLLGLVRRRQDEALLLII